MFPVYFQKESIRFSFQDLKREKRIEDSGDLLAGSYVEEPVFKAIPTRSESIQVVERSKGKFMTRGFRM